MEQITYREALRRGIWEEMEKDSSVVMYGEDVALIGGTYAVSMGMLEKFGPDRILDSPISETAIIGVATGAAMTGLRPIGEIMFIDFILMAMDQLANQAAKWNYMTGGQVNVPMVIRAATGTGRRVAAQHSQSLEAVIAHIPGLKVVMPSTPYDAKGLIRASIRDNNPVVFIEHKLLYNETGDVPEEEYILPIGKADIKREGDDCTIVSYSRMVNFSLKAAEELAKEGISVEVVDLRSIRPLDIDTVIGSVKKTNRLVIVHEACLFGGIGAEIAAEVSENALLELDAPIVRVAAKDAPVPFSPMLEDGSIPSVVEIVDAVKRVARGGV